MAKAYADWCFERRNQLPPEWTAVDTATTDAKAREFLRTPVRGLLPVPSRDPLGLPSQMAGPAAVPADPWRTGDVRAVDFLRVQGRRTRRHGNEALITLGSAPLDWASFRAAVLGQLGESRLQAQSTLTSRARTAMPDALDADTTGLLRDIHRRVATAILFESSGGQTDKSAHLA